MSDDDLHVLHVSDHRGTATAVATGLCGPARQTVTMKLATVTNVSLDGVTQGHRRIDVTTGHDSGGFERFGWGPHLLSASFPAPRVLSHLQSPHPGNPVGEALNQRPKYVASTSLTDPLWAVRPCLSGDVAAAVGELRAGPGGDLQVWGSGPGVHSE